ncbi:MAG: fibronectin type III domain-containing protein, partial [Williamsia sp.]|nr:fibronectin type III domain-containing protein [Williamsia sp.]
VSEKMDGNKNFLTPAVPLADFDEAADSLQTAYNNRKNGKIGKLELELAGENMDITLRTQAMYVTETSKGDNITIETSGFTSSKDGITKAVVPDMPTNVRLESKNGNVCLIAKKPAGATSFCWVVYYGEVADVVKIENNMISVPQGVGAQIINAGKAREVLYGLKPGTLVTVQVLAQNAAGCSALSDAVSIYVNR